MAYPVLHKIVIKFPVGIGCNWGAQGGLQYHKCSCPLRSASGNRVFKVKIFLLLALCVVAPPESC